MTQVLAQAVPPVRLTKFVPIVGIRLALKDIATIYDRLMLQVQEQAEIDIAQLVKPGDKPQSEWDVEVQDLRNQVYRITAVINGRDGSTLTSDDAGVFASANLPDKVGSVFLSNTPAFQSKLNSPPANAFGLNFDFSKPQLLEFGNAVSAPTDNRTNLQIQGSRASWVAGVQAAVQSVTSERRTSRAWLHRAFVYDAGLMLLGIPFAIYVCWKLSAIVNAHFAPMGNFAIAFVYLYCALAIIWIYRILFGYMKWAFPVVELIENNDPSSRHRAVLGGIILALIGNVLWEIRRIV